MAPHVVVDRASDLRTAGRHRGIVDADCHNHPLLSDLVPHLPRRWREYVASVGLRTYTASVAALRPMSSRADAVPPNGVPGNNLDFFRHQLLDAWAIDYALLNPTTMWGGYIGSSQPEDLNDALVRATNDWCAEQWLDREPRFVASLATSIEAPHLAIAEIERWAHESRFVQLLLPVRLRRPIGHPKYLPVLEAAAAHGLPVAFHPGPGENPGHPLTGGGWPSYYIEAMTDNYSAPMAHVASLAFQGTFERIPELKVVMTETGWAWLPSLLARCDRLFEQLHAEVPDLERRPSDVIHDHVWFTTQPMEEPSQPRFFDEVLAQSRLVDRLLFATDYPHWDFDSPSESLPRSLRPETAERIFSENARELFRLPPDVRVAG